ncbi:uncharacterized protein LOC133923404 [Phragmites australis]|uniref:uncharacterized protein LOC133923404 n=1 Tax=Phragmites australis TaxID=29695 RepID=UPI002D793CE2|nr:uncharacterized protein LOC133923404 [Phragmites australis]
MGDGCSLRRVRPPARWMPRGSPFHRTAAVNCSALCFPSAPHRQTARLRIDSGLSPAFPARPSSPLTPQSPEHGAACTRGVRGGRERRLGGSTRRVWCSACSSGRLRRRAGRGEGDGSGGGGLGGAPEVAAANWEGLQRFAPSSRRHEPLPGRPRRPLRQTLWIWISLDTLGNWSDMDLQETGCGTCCSSVTHLT